MVRAPERKLDQLHRAEQLMQQGSIDEARPLLEALEKVDELPPDEQLTYQLLKSQLLITTGDYEESHQLAEQVFKERQERGKLLQAVDACIVMAEAFEWLAGYEESLKVITQGEQLLAALTGEAPAALTQRQAALLERRGRLLFQQEAHDQAMDCFQQSLVKRQELDKKHDIAVALQNIGLSHYSKNEFDLAADYYQRALKLFQEVGNKYRLGWCLTNISGFYSDKGSHNRALEYAQQGMALFQEIGNLRGMAYSLNWISTFYRREGDLDRALEYAQQSMELNQELGNKKQLAYSLLNLGINHSARGEKDRALEFQQQSLALFEELGYKGGIAGSLDALSWIYQSKGDLDRALECQQRSLALYQELGESLRIAGAGHKIALIYWHKGNPDQALAQMAQSLGVIEEVGINRWTAWILLDLVSITLDQGARDQAQHYLQRLQQIYEQEESKQISQRYYLAKALTLKASPRIRDKGEAQALFQQLVEEEMVGLFHYWTELALVNLCELLLDELKAYGEPEVFQEARTVVNRLATAAEDQQAFSLVVNVLILQAKFALIDGDLTAAREFLEQAKVTAEEKDLGLLAEKVAAEQRLLEAQYDTWQRLIQDNAPFGIRLEQARMGDYLKKAQQLIFMESRR